MPGRRRNRGIRRVRRGNRHTAIPDVRYLLQRAPEGPSAAAASSIAAAYDVAAAEDDEPNALENAKKLLQGHTGMAR